PSTVAPAIVLACTEQPFWRVASFIAGVFIVSTAGGLFVLFALGRTLIARLAHPSPHTQHLLELAIGILLVLAPGLLWLYRVPLHSRLGGTPSTRHRRSSFLLGAGIMAVELPTAFPYFAAILATLGTVHGAIRQTAFIALYNLVFVAPLVVVLAVIGIA